RGEPLSGLEVARPAALSPPARNGAYYAGGAVAPPADRRGDHDCRLAPRDRRRKVAWSAALSGGGPGDKTSRNPARPGYRAVLQLTERSHQRPCGAATSSAGDHAGQSSRRRL